MPPSRLSRSAFELLKCHEERSQIAVSFYLGGFFRNFPPSFGSKKPQTAGSCGSYRIRNLTIGTSAAVKVSKHFPDFFKYPGIKSLCPIKKEKRYVKYNETHGEPRILNRSQRACYLQYGNDAAPQQKICRESEQTAKKTFAVFIRSFIRKPGANTGIAVSAAHKSSPSLSALLFILYASNEIRSLFRSAFQTHFICCLPSLFASLPGIPLSFFPGRVPGFMRRCGNRFRVRISGALRQYPFSVLWYNS